MTRGIFAVTVIAGALISTGSVTAQGYEPVSNYLQHCAGCHRMDGSGLPPEVPNLRKDLGYLIDSPEGRDFMVRVPGVVGVPISVEEVTELINWIVESFNPERSDFVRFTVEEVAAGRADPLYDPLRVRKELFPELEL